jgi:hypothetical protein
VTYIRCPQCGAKALNVATMCPKCRVPLTQNPMQAGPHGLHPCAHCAKLIDRDADICPFCGYHVRRARARRRILAIAAVVVVVLGGGTFGLVRAGGVAGLGDWIARMTATDPIVPTIPQAPLAEREQPVFAMPEPDLTPVAEPARAAPTAPVVVPPLVVRYATGWANIRASRGTDSTAIGVLRPGDTVRVATPIGGWWAVWRDGVRVGFVAADLLRTTPIPPDSLPARP